MNNTTDKKSGASVPTEQRTHQATKHQMFRWMLEAGREGPWSHVACRDDGKLASVVLTPGDQIQYQESMAAAAGSSAEEKP
ncbi:hypothetical protein HJFPF1_12410 [Paramyrothecium foliicola]|nr:hypothetical protein HJFPF1_12410 [Paramyrothecium foliicola]